MSTRRVFFAARPQPELRQALAQQLQAQTWPDDRRLQWMPESNWHVTLRFIGDVDSAVVEGLQQSMQATVAQQRQFVLPLTALQAFPDPRRPLVLAATGPAPAEAHAVVAALELLCAAFELQPVSRPWRPHMTLARIRGRRPWPGHAVPLALTLPVADISLMESLPGANGRAYVPLVCAALR